MPLALIPHHAGGLLWTTGNIGVLLITLWLAAGVCRATRHVCWR